MIATETEAGDSLVGARLGRFAVGVATVCLHAVPALVTVLVSIGEPAIAQALGISEIHANHLGEAFIGAQVCTLPLSSRLITAWGIVAVLRRCGVGFVLAALATALVAASPTLRSQGVLSLLLVLQGICAAPLTPATQALVVHSYPGALRTRGLAIWAIGQYLGFAVGALLAGWIVEQLTWPLLFVVAPLVAILPLPFLDLDAHLHDRNPRAIRSGPAVALVFGTVAAAIALVAIPAPDLARALAAGAALTALFAFELSLPRPRILAHELRRPSLATLRNRWFALAAALTLGVQALTTGQFEVLLLSGPLGVPPEIVSLRTLVGGLTQIAAAAVAGYLLGRTWLRAAIAVSLVAMAAGTATYLFYVPGVDEATQIWTRVLVGLGAGLSTPALATAAFEYLPERLTAQGATIFAIATSLGVLVGLIVLDTVYAAAKDLLDADALLAYHVVIQAETVGLAALMVLTLPLRSPKGPLDTSSDERRSD